MLGSKDKKDYAQSFGLDEARRRRVVVGGRRPAAGHGRKFVALDEWLVLDNSIVDNVVMCVI